MRALEALAARVRAASASDDQLALIRATEAVLFDECGFRGVDADEYYAASNSFLDEVLRRRAGIPISLACLFVAVAERAGVKRGALRPVSAPGHFLLAFGDDDAFDDAADVFFSRAIFLDVFARHRGPRYGSLTFGQVAAFIARHVGVNEQQAALYLHDACKNYALPDEVGARCARNLMLIMENEERRSLAGSVGITHGVRPLAALDIYRQLEHHLPERRRPDPPFPPPPLRPKTRAPPPPLSAAYPPCGLCSKLSAAALAAGRRVVRDPPRGQPSTLLMSYSMY